MDTATVSAAIEGDVGILANQIRINIEALVQPAWFILDNG